MVRARARKLFDSKTNFPDNARFRSEGFPSGQRDQTVNLTALPSKVRILPPPPQGQAARRPGSGGTSEGAAWDAMGIGIGAYPGDGSGITGGDRVLVVASATRV